MVLNQIFLELLVDDFDILLILILEKKENQLETHLLNFTQAVRFLIKIIIWSDQKITWFRCPQL